MPFGTALSVKKLNYPVRKSSPGAEPAPPLTPTPTPTAMVAGSRGRPGALARPSLRKSAELDLSLFAPLVSDYSIGKRHRGSRVPADDG